MGVLKSMMFADIQVFEDCAVDDAKHIVPGTIGLHVVMIQGALATVGGQKIDEREVDKKLYGVSTAAAVANFKRSHKPPLLNYRNQIDPIVGKKTIAALDALMAERDAARKGNSQQPNNQRPPRTLDPHRPMARIGSVSGDVWITVVDPDGIVREKKAQPGMTLFIGTRVRTGRAGGALDKLLGGENDGRATIIFNDGSVLTLGPGTLIVILHDSNTASIVPDRRI